MPPFESKPLILSGEIHIRRAGGGERTSRAGDVSHLPAKTTHTERYGAHGVEYLVGRK